MELEIKCSVMTQDGTRGIIVLTELDLEELIIRRANKQGLLPWRNESMFYWDANIDEISFKKI